MNNTIYGILVFLLVITTAIIMLIVSRLDINPDAMVITSVIIGVLFTIISERLIFNKRP